jgi:hypothetical protein
MTQPPEAKLRYEWMEHPMPRNMGVVRPDRVLVVETVEDYMTVTHKVLEKQLAARGYDPTSWLVYKEDCGSPTRGARVATLCIQKGSPVSRTIFSFSLVATERLPPRAASFALMDYKVPARAFIKKGIQTGRNPLLPNYVGHIGRKPVYDTNGPLEYMDDIIICMDRGVGEVTTEEWGKLKGCPSSWGNTAKDQRWVIWEPSLHFWSVLGDVFAPTLTHKEEPGFGENREEDTSIAGMPPFSTRPIWEEDSSDEESECEDEHPLPEEVELPPNMDAHFDWKAPDLIDGGEWCDAWLDKLRTITEGWHDQDCIMVEGRRILASHHLNYTSQGAQHMEILWWEWPSEHWESLRFGGSMNFMETPVSGLEGNEKMTESQLKIAVAFVTELIIVVVLGLVPQGVVLVNVCPLVLVAKPGQPDQWKCIADMKKGHRTNHVQQTQCI